MVSTIIGTEITAVFAEDGTLSGSAGCNNYTSSYESDDVQIKIGPAASTRMFCAEPEGSMDQESQYLAALLKALMDCSRALAKVNNGKRRPLLVKIAPDLSWPELDDILQAITDQGVDGIIATNTTISRPELSSDYQSESGGLSGAPLADNSTDIIRYIARHTEDKLPIIGVGGIQSATDVKIKIDAGASLVQLYTGLIYQGPGIAGRILRDLQK